MNGRGEDKEAQKRCNHIMGNQCTAEDSRDDEMRSEEKEANCFDGQGRKRQKLWKDGGRGTGRGKVVEI